LDKLVLEELGLELRLALAEVLNEVEELGEVRQAGLDLAEDFGHIRLLFEVVLPN